MASPVEGLASRSTRPDGGYVTDDHVGFGGLGERQRSRRTPGWVEWHERHQRYWRDVGRDAAPASPRAGLRKAAGDAGATDPRVGGPLGRQGAGLFERASP